MMINKTKIFTYFSSFFGVGILMLTKKTNSLEKKGRVH